MIYRDYYLKFKDHADQKKHFDLDADPPIIHPGCHFTVVGLLYEPTGKMIIDKDTGVDYPESRPVAGWHVNVAIDGDLPEALKPLEIPAPKTPSVVRYLIPLTGKQRRKLKDIGQEAIGDAAQAIGIDTPSETGSKRVGAIRAGLSEMQLDRLYSIAARIEAQK